MTTYTYDTDSPIELNVRVEGCDVEVHASDRTETTVTIAARDGAALDDVAVARVRVRRDGDRVLVDDTRRNSLRRRSCDYDVHVDVPTCSSIVMAVGSGDVTTTGSLGGVRVKTGSGDVRVDDCASAAVTTGRGDVEIGSVASGVSAKSGSGNLAVRVASAGGFSLLTGMGDIRIGIPEGVAAQLDTKSGSGTIENRIASSDTRPEAVGYITVRARTGMGDMVIERAIKVS